MASKDFVYDHQYLNLVTDGQPMEQLQNKANMYVALGHYNYNWAVTLLTKWSLWVDLEEKELDSALE